LPRQVTITLSDEAVAFYEANRAAQPTIESFLEELLEKFASPVTLSTDEDQVLTDLQGFLRTYGRSAPFHTLQMRLFHISAQRYQEAIDGLAQKGLVNVAGTDVELTQQGYHWRP